MHITKYFGNHSRFELSGIDAGNTTPIYATTWADEDQLSDTTQSDLSEYEELADGTYEGGKFLRNDIEYTSSADGFDTGPFNAQARDSAIVTVDTFTDSTRTTLDKKEFYVYDRFGRGYHIPVKFAGTISNFDGSTVVVDHASKFQSAKSKTKRLIALENDNGDVEFMLYDKKTSSNLNISDRSLYSGISSAFNNGDNVYIIGATGGNPVSLDIEIIDTPDTFIGSEITMPVSIDGVESTDTLVGSEITIPIAVESLTSTDTLVGSEITIPMSVDVLTSDDILSGSETIIPLVIESLTSDDILSGSEITIPMSVDVLTSDDILSGSETIIPLVIESLTSDDILSGSEMIIPLVIESLTSDDTLVGSEITIPMSVDVLTSDDILSGSEITIPMSVDVLTSDDTLVGSEITIPMTVESLTSDDILVGDENIIPITIS
jgi:hypothetical protein